MRIFYINLVILLIVSACASADERKTTKIATTDKKSEEPKLGELQALEKVEDLDDQEAEEVNRKKKSATTTFCVEIRPSGEDQRPFQVCEPAVDPTKANYGAPGYYQSPQSYGSGGQEQQKPHPAPYQSQTGQTKPAAAAFTSSVKTFAGSTQAAAASKPYSSSMPYGGYRSNDDDDVQLKRISPDSGSDEEHDSLENGRARSSYDGYSSSYGVPPSYTPSNKKHHPHSGSHGQNGLVITCQPSLAGYAHPPSMYHGPTMPVPSYSYRSSSGRYARPYQPYRQYGGYQHPGGYKPVYQPQPKPMGKPNAPAYQQYKPAPYPPPVYSQPESPAYSPQPYKAPAYSQPPQEYKPQSYSPPPAAEYKPESYSPEYKQPAYSAPPSQDYKPQAYPPPVPEYKPQQYPPAASHEHEYMAPPPAKPPAHSPSYSPVPSPVYVPPGTYRSSEMSKDETQSTKTEEMNDKESHTMKKMEEMTEQRAAGGPWGAEIESEGTKKDEPAMAGGWRQAEGAEEETKESARENEVDEHM